MPCRRAACAALWLPLVRVPMGGGCRQAGVLAGRWQLQPVARRCHVSSAQTPHPRFELHRLVTLVSGRGTGVSAPYVPRLLPADEWPKRASVAIVFRHCNETDNCQSRDEAKAASTSDGSRPGRGGQGGGDTDIEVLFIQRKVNEADPWSGNVAFPGGRRDASDKDDCATAEREVLEEVGIDLRNGDFEFAGRLCDRDVTARGRRQKGLALSAFVFVQRAGLGRPEMRLDEREIESARWVSVSELEAAGAIDRRGVARDYVHLVVPAVKRLTPRLRSAVGLDTVYFPAFVDATADPPFVLWGLTLRALSDALELGGGSRLDWPPVSLNSKGANVVLWAIFGVVELASHTPATSMRPLPITPHHQVSATTLFAAMPSLLALATVAPFW
eukprot:m.31606 g.31606  ORF g.31606 m.31606 type:complete len:387 (-) comp9787_c0_seq1:49-1209(-)